MVEKKVTDVERIIFEGFKKKEKGKKVEGKRKKKIFGESLFSRRKQLEDFWEEQPFFYDKSKIFYLWNDEFKKWEVSDEIDFLNSIQEKLGVDTIDNKTRLELVEGFKQIGRKHSPEKPKRFWVQFKNKIYNAITGNYLFVASPKYFIKNPIPYDLGKSEDTPTIDKLFCEWVGEENKIKLYELFAYAMTPDRFMQRIFALVGGGSNGKGSLIKLLIKFIGKENYVTSELKELSENQFETAILYAKLLCVLGEISYGDLRNTNQLKKIAGEDDIRFCFKGKTPFSDLNTALCVCLTNSLPVTPDKTIGFYRKWNIIDFPNQFKQIKENLISQIPEEEFNNLALRCLNILKGLYKNPIFNNEGNFEERMKKYEERSNPVLRFVEEFCEEIPEEKIILRDFSNECNNYLKEKHLRVLSANQISKILREEGFQIGNRKINDITSYVILNLSLKKFIKPLKLIESQVIPYVEMNEKSVSSVSIMNSQRELDPKLSKDWSDSDKKRLESAIIKEKKSEK